MLQEVPSLQPVLRISNMHAQCTVKELHGIIRDSSLVNHHGSILVSTFQLHPITQHSPSSHGCSSNCSLEVRASLSAQRISSPLPSVPSGSG